ncbi:MAG: ATP-binding protein, partial [Blautia sp.]
DEIQHLSEAKGGGSDKMLNFFVTLVNTIGVPVVLIGTTKAMSLLQGEFRQARRGSGQGDLIWDRMSKDAAWNLFVRSMWRYQWTRTVIPLSAELSEVLYDESQGIIDIAVKLYAIVQIDAITSGKESFSVEDIRRTAVKKLALVKPMLDALRSGDKKKILKYGDITPISIEDYLSAYQMPVEEIERKTPEQKLSVMEQTVIKLMEVDVAPGTARKLAGRVAASHKNPITVGQAFKEAYQMYLSDTQAKAIKEEKQVDKDIRRSDSYEGLKQSGLVDDLEW